jgi:hypothetical protein
MKVISTFEDSTLRKVISKCQKPILDRRLALEAGETLTVIVPTAGRRKLVYILSSLTLVDANTSEAELRIDGTASHSLKLTPGEAQVIPVDDDVNYFRVVSNSATDGTVRLVVL